jgi:hypothetical protein
MYRNGIQIADKDCKERIFIVRKDITRHQNNRVIITIEGRNVQVLPLSLCVHFN